MRPHGSQAQRVRLVQILLYPLPVDLVGARIARQRVHVACVLLETLQILVAVIEEDVLIVEMVPGQQQAHGGGEREPAVRAVGGETLIARIGRRHARQILRIGERVQAQMLVADAHVRCREVHVLQTRGIPRREGEILFYQSRRLPGADNLVGRQPAQTHQPRIVHDALELPDGFHEFRRRAAVYLLRNDMPAAQGAEIALLPAAFFRRLRQIDVAPVVQVGPLVEMPLESAREETRILFLQVGSVAFAHEPVLLVQNGKRGQDFQCLAPRPMQRLVLRSRYGVQFGKHDLECRRDVRILREDAALFHRQQRELRFERRSL